jgi:hypothetical protein
VAGETTGRQDREVTKIQKLERTEGKLEVLALNSSFPGLIGMIPGLIKQQFARNARRAYTID